MSDSNKISNRLIREKSPYLLQHAHNPVDWYPWGDEAFQKAKAEDNPVFLSIGYSTCHWCHVMERQTFEDVAAARWLNENFVSIKVDREERPDIDHVYMEVCQAMTGSGGWPLSIFMDEERRPFFAGTYYTNAQFISLLAQIRKIWDSDRGKLQEASDDILKYLHAKTSEKGTEDKNLPHVAYGELKKSFDARHGGFSYAPKFPSPHLLLFLMEYARANQQPQALEMALKTLDAMDRGGIHDHIGYGFCRYSTDTRWLVPHFEKMLYDNALLAYSFAVAYTRTGGESLKRTAQSTLAYLERMMRSPEGGFYTAEDADSEGEEGKFYLWDQSEVNDLLDGRARDFCDHYDISLQGNFEGKNIPNLIDNPLGLDELPDFEEERKILFDAREKRVHPFLDDKILSCWNGLGMAAFAFAGKALKTYGFIQTATEIWQFIQEKLTDEKVLLLSSYREGQAKNPAHADDWAYLIWGLLELYEAAFDMDVLSHAVSMNKMFLENFWDKESGGLFYTGQGSEKLIARTKTVYDGATPSANSVQAMNLLRLSGLTGDLEMRDRAVDIFRAFAGETSRSPGAYAHMMNAILKSSREEMKIVLVGKTKNDLNEMIDAARGPDADVVVIAENEKIPENLRGYFSEYQIQDEGPTAYVCRGNTCLPPVRGAEALKHLLNDR